MAMKKLFRVMLSGPDRTLLGRLSKHYGSNESDAFRQALVGHARALGVTVPRGSTKPVEVQR